MSIEQLRRKLVDLTLRNKLLTMRFGRGGAIRIVDEMPERVYSDLLEGISYAFEPLPEPTPEDLKRYTVGRAEASDPEAAKRPDEASWAAFKGINASYDLPPSDQKLAQQHADRKLQALFYRDKLETLIRRLASDARAAIEETGSNMLFLGLGFLEWIEEKAGTPKTHLAPLLLVPVRLEKADVSSGLRSFKLEWNGEDVQENLALRLLLERDFNIKLPAFDDEQGVEAFFAQVRTAVRTQAKWNVRRQAYVTLISQLGKLLLYNDLEAARWFGGKGVTAHSIVGRLLGADNRETGEISFEDRVAVSDETIAAELDLPVTDRIDSSQLEALRLALAGENLVIQGPPGTGKSQTITNIIAAAMAQGKSVLFVAEKLAAIEVVKRRLDGMGLGDFCLELHSNRTRKKSFLETVQERLEMSPAPPSSEFTERHQRLSMRRKALSEYAAAAGRRVTTDKSVADVLFAAGRSALPLGDWTGKVIDAGITNHLAEMLPQDGTIDHTQMEMHDQLAVFVPALAAIQAEGPLDTNPWKSTANPNLLQDDLPSIRRLLDTTSIAAQQLEQRKHSVSALLSCDAAIEIDDDEFSRLQSAAEGLAKIWPVLASGDEAIDAARENISINIPSGRAGLLVLLRLGDLAAVAPQTLDRLLHDGLHAPEVASALASARGRAPELKNSLTALRAWFPIEPRDDEASLSGLRASADALSNTPVVLRLFSRKWRDARETLGRLGAKKKAAKPTEWASRLKLLADALQQRRTLLQDPALIAAMGSKNNGLDTDFEGLIACCEWIEAVRKANQATPALAPFTQQMFAMSQRDVTELAKLQQSTALSSAREALVKVNAKHWPRGTSLVNELIGSLPAKLKDAISKNPTASTAQQVAAIFADVSQSQRTLADAQHNLTSTLCVEQPSQLSDLSPRELLAHLSVWNETLSRLPAWSRYVRARSSVANDLVLPLIGLAEQGKLPAEHLPAAWTFAYYRAVGRRLYQSDPALGRSSGAALNSLRAEFRALDEEVMSLRRKQIAAILSRKSIPAGNPGPRVKDMTNRAMLMHELGKQRAHRPIREVMRRAGTALKAMKPCFMMGPLSVAQYLEPGALEFDIIIMDEASQLRPEEALSAIVRGKQLIVVGDDKQLPPTTFFDRIDEPDEDDEEEEIVGVREESILRLAAQAFPARMLLWHYRSRNEALIAFSNYNFYRNQLIVFPTPNSEPGQSGIQFNFVGDATCAEGINDVEARRVAEAAAEHLRTDGRSLIVVAMNIKQKERIRAHFYDLTKDDPAFAVSTDGEQRNEPFDIKNLENVQGDERDVVMISMTYGPDPASGRVARRFGPINGQFGHRRLNVLFSRAREKMIVFSSMRYGQVMLGDSASEGVKALRDFLFYAETKVLHSDSAPVGTGRPPDSDFEVAVAQSLERHGYECVAQLGVAGFFLDIAVRDPENRERFLLGIECDGASYHSTRSARDRDRLRQEVLEGLDWRIERVWSTDWFLDPSSQINRLVSRLDYERRRSP